MQSRKIATSKIINLRMLMVVVGWLLMIEAVFMIVPMVTCLIYGESDWVPFAATAGATVITGAVLAFMVRPHSHHLGKREGYLLTASVWLIYSFFGLIPFLFCHDPLSYSDAFFEAVSGFTTTGATVLDVDHAVGHGMHIWRAMMQWIGGMGIILFTLAVIPMLNHSGGIQMFNAEVTGVTHDKISPRISQTAKKLWLVYLSLTVVLVLLLWAGPMTLFDSICYAFGTVSTGGYSSNPEGVAFWHGSLYVKVVLVVFMFAGGVNFSLIYKASRGNFRAMGSSDVFRWYMRTVGICMLIFAAAILTGGHASGWQSWSIDPLFQVVSTITSTGFAITDFADWGPLVLAVTFVLMFSGACAGSTSGGAKIDRMLFLIKHSSNEVYRCLHPNSIMSVKLNGRIVSPELVGKVVAFLCIYMMLIVIGGAVLTAFGVPVVDAFFSSFSCMSNTGLSAGVTGYGASYSILPDAAKWILSLLMITGRLEIFTVLVLFTPTFWRR